MNWKIPFSKISTAKLRALLRLDKRKAARRQLYGELLRRTAAK